MLVFCPYCGTMLQIEEGDVCMQFSCPSCPYVCPVTKKVSSRIYPKLKDLEEVLGGPSVWDNAQVTNERCPKCSHERAYFMQIQTRSADEPMTIFYRCANADCCHRWKD
ncbi:transcription factor S-II [Oesophagostomum dentatum]|uniref:DNA-directed RNA polymerase subunit n=1 Tax=Oesophagostomum dentatum TaxID=61180 RepID=A0A0B1TAI1_OESDE|nr:transcription factor S-II [Oesophagostomum dentatum]